MLTHKVFVNFWQKKKNKHLRQYKHTSKQHQIRIRFYSVEFCSYWCKVSAKVGMWVVDQMRWYAKKKRKVYIISWCYQNSLPKNCTVNNKYCFLSFYTFWVNVNFWQKANTSAKLHIQKKTRFYSVDVCSCWCRV